SRTASDLGPETAPASTCDRRRRHPTKLSLILPIAAVLVFVAVDRAGAEEMTQSAPESVTDAILSDEGFAGGYSFPGTGLWIGGDATIEASVPEDTHSSVKLDELSLLLRWEPLPRLAFFTEMKLDELVSFSPAEGVPRGDRVLSIERLYLDWAATPTLTVRAGKFLTPFGLWNLIRRTPLSWTVERPLVTERFFPEHTTGLQLLYQTTWQGW